MGYIKDNKDDNVTYQHCLAIEHDLHFKWDLRIKIQRFLLFILIFLVGSISGFNSIHFGGFPQNVTGQ